MLATRVLIGRPGEDDRLAAPAGERAEAAAPGDVGQRWPAVGVVPDRGPGRLPPAPAEVQLGGADSGHQRVAVRPGRYRAHEIADAVIVHIGGPAVPRGGQDRDALPDRVQVGGPQREQAPRTGETQLAGAETLADDPAQVVVDDVGLRPDDGREAGTALVLRRRSLDQQDAGARRDRVGVLDVEVGLARPAGAIGRRPVGRHRARWLDDGELRRRREPGGQVEDRQVAAHRRRAE